MSARTLLMAPPAAAGGGDPYADEVLADSPTAYWKLDEASGNFADSSGNGNTATATGAFVYSRTALLGGSSSSVEFDATNSIGDFGTLFSSQDTVTFELWFEPTSTDPGGLMEAGGSSVGLQVEMDGSGNVVAAHGASGLSVTSSTTLSTGTAYHIVVTSEINVGMHLYINGTSEGSQLSGSWGAATGANAGGFGDPNGLRAGSANTAALGYYDEVAGYLTALSSTRVAAHYDARGNA